MKQKTKLSLKSVFFMLFIGLVQTPVFAADAATETSIELSEAEIAVIVAKAEAAATPEEAAQIAAAAAEANPEAAAQIAAAVAEAVPAAAAQINAAVSAAVPSAAAQIAANQAQPSVETVETAAGNNGGATPAQAKVSAAIPPSAQGAAVTSELQVANGFEDVSPQ